ncbi:MAG: hypothetical protein AW07_01286 [Candidatus Accumulibacter sp. SK-11]|nr:MAG: hypothetical protein AW07_01286 [Candidatus Accumulibacter sp. SK-11]
MSEKSVSSRPATLTCTNWPPRPLSLCSACANISLPAPVSPEISTGSAVPATASRYWKSALILRLLVTMPAKASLFCRQSDSR